MRQLSGEELTTGACATSEPLACPCPIRWPSTVAARMTSDAMIQRMRLILRVDLKAR